MLGKKNSADDRAVERISSLVLKASAKDALGVDEIADNIDYRKIRARIAATKSTPVADPWSALLSIARRAIPALCLIAVVAMAWSWLTGNRASGASLNNAITGASGAGTQRIRAGGTCAISTSDQCSVSTEDVLATLVKEGVR